jgi:hypothetical protein
MTDINTLDEALTWLQARGWDTEYRNPEGLHDSRRISKRRYDERFGKDILDYTWCRSDQAVIDFAREKQIEQLNAAAPELYAALAGLIKRYIANKGTKHQFVICIGSSHGELPAYWQKAFDAIKNAEGAADG